LWWPDFGQAPFAARELTGEELTAISQEIKTYRGFLK
jgi:hypothetical protein